MVGNKHKNGITCMFPGCGKTMRTQKFKLHFTKQHLAPSEEYSIEHRRQYEVARDNDNALSSPVRSTAKATTKAATATPAAAATAMIAQLPVVKQQPLSDQPTTVPVQIIASPVPAAAAALTAVPSALPGLTTTVLSPVLNNATGNSATALPSDSSSSFDVASVGTSHHLAAADALEQQEHQQLLQRLHRMESQYAPVAQRIADARAAHTATATMGITPPSPATATNSLLSSSSNERPAAAAADPSRVVLAQYVELMDQRFDELIQKMAHVIDGQQELIRVLRQQPIPTDVVQLLAQTPSLAQQLLQSHQSPDASSYKRRKVSGANDAAQQQQQQQHEGANGSEGASSELL